MRRYESGARRMDGPRFRTPVRARAGGSPLPGASRLSLPQTAGGGTWGASRRLLRCCRGQGAGMRTPRIPLHPTSARQRRRKEAVASVVEASRSLRGFVPFQPWLQPPHHEPGRNGTDPSTAPTSLAQFARLFVVVAAASAAGGRIRTKDLWPAEASVKARPPATPRRGGRGGRPRRTSPASRGPRPRRPASRAPSAGSRGRSRSAYGR